MTLVHPVDVSGEREILRARQLDAQSVLMMLESAIVTRGATYMFPKFQHERYAVYPETWDEMIDAPGRALGPGCLIGQAFTEIGFLVSDLEKMDRQMGPFNKTAFERLFPGWRITEQAALMLRVAQKAQDQRVPWGTAYHRAMAEMVVGHGSQF